MESNNQFLSGQKMKSTGYICRAVVRLVSADVLCSVISSRGIDMIKICRVSEILVRSNTFQ